MIKRLIPLMVCLLLGGVAFAQGGVEFRDLTFDEALVKAKAEKKLVFVDCYRRFSNHHLFSFVNQKTSLTVLDDAAHIVGNEKDRFSCFFQIVKFPVTLGLEENVSDA